MKYKEKKEWITFICQGLLIPDTDAAKQKKVKKKEVHWPAP